MKVEQLHQPIILLEFVEFVWNLQREKRIYNETDYSTGAANGYTRQPVVLQSRRHSLSELN